MKRLKRPANTVRARKDAKFLKRVTFYALLEGFSESFIEGYVREDEKIKEVFEKLISLCRIAQAKAHGNITGQDTRAIHRAMVRFSDECITGSTYAAVFAFFLNYSDDLITEINNPNTVYRMIHKTLLSVSDYIEGAYKEHYKSSYEFFLDEFGKGNDIMTVFSGIFKDRDSFYDYGKDILIDENVYAELMGYK
jgi:hypothetical protein